MDRIFIQTISMATCFAIIVLKFIIIKKNPCCWKYEVSSLLWAINGILFYNYYLYTTKDWMIFGIFVDTKIWISIFVLQGLLTAFGKDMVRLFVKWEHES